MVLKDYLSVVGHHGADVKLLAPIPHRHHQVLALMPPTVAAIHAHLWIAAAIHADLWIVVLAAHLPHTVCHTPHAIVQQVLRILRRLFENRGRAEGWMCWKIFPRIWRRRGGHGRERKRRDGGRRPGSSEESSLNLVLISRWRRSGGLS
jgi:hypothetical protein